MFYRAKQSEWLLFVLPKGDIKQINMICCKDKKTLEIRDIDNMYKQHVNIVLYAQNEFNGKENCIEFYIQLMSRLVLCFL